MGNGVGAICDGAGECNGNETLCFVFTSLTGDIDDDEDEELVVD